LGALEDVKIVAGGLGETFAYGSVVWKVVWREKKTETSGGVKKIRGYRK